jgi:hypothetical protein
MSIFCIMYIFLSMLINMPRDSEASKKLIKCEIYISMLKMDPIDSRSLPVAYSIDLYAINLKKRNVPEKFARISNYIRRFTPEGGASNAFVGRLAAESTKKSYILPGEIFPDLRSDGQFSNRRDVINGSCNVVSRRLSILA